MGEAAAVAVTAGSDGGTRGQSVLKRLASAAILIPLFVWAVLGPSPWPFRLIVIVAAAGAAWELLALFERAGRVTHRLLGAVLAAVVAASFLVPGAPVPALTACAVLILGVPLLAGQLAAGEAAPLTLFAVAYVGWLLGHALLLHGLPEGAFLILFLVGVTWAGESGAYLIGSLLGRHALAPVISPRKTVEGALAQTVISVGVALALAAWLLPAWSMVQAAVAGLLLGVAGQIGDLSESAIKRSVGAKDAGSLIPGHGGLLDRLDGLLFNTPALYYYARLLGVGS